MAFFMDSDETFPGAMFPDAAFVGAPLPCSLIAGEPLPGDALFEFDKLLSYLSGRYNRATRRRLFISLICTVIGRRRS
jgi:hypothetical protein